MNPFEKIKKPRKSAGGGDAGEGSGAKGVVKKEERRKVISYEERKGVSGLGDLCIKVSWGTKPM